MSLYGNIFFCRIDMENIDSEMSIFITSLAQLQPIKHILSKLMWDFIEGLFPNPVGYVVPRIGKLFPTGPIIFFKC